jgi:8-oxo-dGTP pyrophosphatase MutT (NUDIX family)
VKTAVGTVFLSTQTGRVLLQLRNSAKRHRHTWGFWGGMIEEGETPYQALQRELTEEIGIVPDIARLNPIDVYQSRDGDFMYYSFVSIVEEEFSPILNGESAGYAWVDIGVWPQPLHDGARETLTKNQGTAKLHTILKINKK